MLAVATISAWFMTVKSASVASFILCRVISKSVIWDWIVVIVSWDAAWTVMLETYWSPDK